VAYGIAQPCVGHKDPSCPTEAVAGLPSGPCIHCGLYVSACPVGAIFPEEDLPEAWAFYADGNRAYFRRLGA